MSKKSEKIMIEDMDMQGYSPQREIAHTSTSLVYIALNPMKKFCCLKLVRRPNSNPSDAQFFASEANALSILNHKSISPVRDYFFNEKFYCLVSDAKKGGSLQRLLEKNHVLSNEEAQSIVFSIANAIQFCHTRNISHRNIKPSNILMEQDSFFLSDFGIRQIDVTSHSFNTAIPYRAPELLDQIIPEFCTNNRNDSGSNSDDEDEEQPQTEEDLEAKAAAEQAAAISAQMAAINSAVKSDATRIDEKPCDIWSLGVVTYEMITGKLPWTATKPNDLVQQIKRGAFTFPPTVQPLARDLITKMLMTSPMMRISSHEVLAHPWLSKIRKTNLRGPSGKSSGSQKSSSQSTFQANSKRILNKKL